MALSSNSAAHFIQPAILEPHLETSFLRWFKQHIIHYQKQNCLLIINGLRKTSLISGVYTHNTPWIYQYDLKTNTYSLFLKFADELYNIVGCDVAMIQNTINCMQCYIQRDFVL